MTISVAAGDLLQSALLQNLIQVAVSDTEVADKSSLS